MPSPPNPPGLAGVNALPRLARLRLLAEVCAAPEWARQVSDGAPYPDADALLAAADRVLDGLSEDDVDAALAAHPRIGDRPDNAASAREQAGMADADADVRAELAARNAEYEDRFGHVYLVCASGRSAEELLAVLTDRLRNDPGTERRVVRAELGKINRLRLQRLLGVAG